MNRYNQKWVKIIFDPFNHYKAYAVTIWKTSYFSCPESEVNLAWHKHEDKHKEQWQHDGFVKFLALYIYYSIRYGYSTNPYEVEAVKAETL